MKTPILKAFAACLLLSLPAASFATDEAEAESAPARRGNHLIQVGVFHIDTLDDSEPLHTTLKPGAAALLGVQSEFDSEGTGAQVSSSDTLALIYSYFLTDHVALKFEGGIPARFKLYGTGTVAPTGPAGALINVDLGDPANNPLAKVTQWSPVFMVQYFFRDPRKEIRPYVGLGVTYTWFTDIKPDPDFEDALNNRFGRTLALVNLSPGQTTVDAKASSDIAPVFNMGVTAELSKHWSLSGSLSLSLLSTKAKITIDAANGDRLVTSTTQLDLNPLVAALLLGYRFDL
jgi:outer membrane protein